MIKQAISPLRRRMIEDMEIRGFAAKTQRGYIRAVRDFTAFLDRSPDQATAEDLRRHQLEMRSKGASATSINAAVSALRFFFSVTLGRDDARTGMTTVREPRKLPVVLSPDEVARLLDAAPGLKYKAAFSVAYQNKAVVYTILFKAAAETLIAIAADPKHLGARIGLTAVLHTWGAALTPLAMSAPELQTDQISAKADVVHGQPSRNLNPSRPEPVPDGFAFARYRLATISLCSCRGGASAVATRCRALVRPLEV